MIAHVASNPMQQLVQAFDRGDITTARRHATQLDKAEEGMRAAGLL